MKQHVIKCWPEYFEAVLLNIKPFEVRKDDRDYQVMDVLVLVEYDPETKKYTGRDIHRLISYKLEGGQFGIEKGYCVLGLINI